MRRAEKNSVLAINVYKSECTLCGKIWQWDEDSPLQNVQVRPDLIQKGAKKLEEDAVRAAWYWQQQQDAKKKR